MKGYVFKTEHELRREFGDSWRDRFNLEWDGPVEDALGQAAHSALVKYILDFGAFYIEDEMITFELLKHDFDAYDSAEYIMDNSGDLELRRHNPQEYSDAYLRRMGKNNNSSSSKSLREEAAMFGSMSFDHADRMFSAALDKKDSEPVVKDAPYNTTLLSTRGGFVQVRMVD